MSSITSRQVSFIRKLDVERGVTTNTDGMSSKAASARISELLAMPKAAKPAKRQPRKAKIQIIPGELSVGDVLPPEHPHNPSITIMPADRSKYVAFRVTGLGKEWTDHWYMDEEDARSVGGQGESMRGTQRQQYAYCEEII